MTPLQIRQRRAELRLTQGEFAALVGLSVQAIRNYEAGRRTPHPRCLRAIEATLLPPAEEEGCNGKGACPCRCHQGTRQWWSTGELAYLRVALERGDTPKEIAAALQETFETRRTPDAVARRANAIGISFRDSWYSENDVVNKLGVSAWRVRQWRERGLLAATRHIGRARSRECHWWRIEEAALSAFVEAHAGSEFDPANVRDRTLKARAQVAAAQNRRRVS